ncbi:hypothetical protein [Streptomyces sp. NPDC005907]|uniref:hypothetical protein n=1 Tax=Streptomyces sp. NPDC005907 TaxID=3154571 RepID=UPI0033E3973A
MQYAVRLEALLGDPRDRANPYGRAALWAAGHDALPAPPAELTVAGKTPPAPWELARALRPLLRRDLALAHAWSTGPLLHAVVPHPAAALLGPAALLASAAGVLRGATRIVDGLSRYEPGAGQWQPVLAAVFADLLACESLTALALRSCPAAGPDVAAPDAAGQHEAGQPGAGQHEARPDAPGCGAHSDSLGAAPLAAVVGYLVPLLLEELLGDLELVLNECGFDADTLERRTLAKILDDRKFAGADWAAARAAQACLVRGLNSADRPPPGWQGEPAALFRIGEAAPAAAPGTHSPQALAATLPAAARRLAATGTAGTVALARLGRRLSAEQRALRAACAAAPVHEPADPAARALADRQALLVLAAAVLGVREAAAATPESFFGDTDWTLLALARITGRLALPLPDHTPQTWPGVWDELARRATNGVDYDLYATRLPW